MSNIYIMDVEERTTGLTLDGGETSSLFHKQHKSANLATQDKLEVLAPTEALLAKPLSARV